MSDPVLNSAKVRWTPNQRAVYVGAVLGLAACAAVDFSVFLAVFSFGMLFL